MKTRYSKYSKFCFSKQVRKKKQKEYLQKMIEKVLEIKTESIILDTHDLTKTPKNIARTPRPENMNFHKIVKSQFI